MGDQDDDRDECRLEDILAFNEEDLKDYTATSSVASDSIDLPISIATSSQLRSSRSCRLLPATPLRLRASSGTKCRRREQVE